MVTELKVEDGKANRYCYRTWRILWRLLLFFVQVPHLKGKILIGDIDYVGGQMVNVCRTFSQSLLDNGIELMRFKTGTPARVDKTHA